MPESSSFLTAVLQRNTVGVLSRELGVAVADISRGGCLLESASALAVGMVARLTVVIEGTPYTEDVRVARCLAIPGAGAWHHVGVEFLTLRQPGPKSLRMYAAALGERAASAQCVARGKGFESAVG